MSLRSTKITMKNKAGSSRSTSILRICITNPSGKNEGEIKIIDMAGSEWISADQIQHDKVDQMIAVGINFTMMAFK